MWVHFCFLLVHEQERVFEMAQEVQDRDVVLRRLKSTEAVAITIAVVSTLAMFVGFLLLLAFSNQGSWIATLGAILCGVGLVVALGLMIVYPQIVDDIQGIPRN